MGESCQQSSKHNPTMHTLMISIHLYTQFTVVCVFNDRWVKKSPAARALSLYSLADGLEKKRKDLAASIRVQTGLSVEEAEQEVEMSISRLSDWAAHCDKHVGRMPVRFLIQIFSYILQKKHVQLKRWRFVSSQLLPHTGTAFSTPEALGIVGVVLPDTKSLLPLVAILGAAVSMGNAVIIVPSEKFPLPALDFIQVNEKLPVKFLQ